MDILFEILSFFEPLLDIFYILLGFAIFALLFVLGYSPLDEHESPWG